MPPYGDENLRLVKPGGEVSHGVLNDTKKWLAETPVVVVLRDGKALKAWQGYAPTLDELLNAAFGQ
jgi:hypothetical protein